jgi:hypothetical protein
MVRKYSKDIRDLRQQWLFGKSEAAGCSFLGAQSPNRALMQETAGAPSHLSDLLVLNSATEAFFGVYPETQLLFFLQSLGFSVQVSCHLPRGSLN